MSLSLFIRRLLGSPRAAVSAPARPPALSVTRRAEPVPDTPQPESTAWTPRSAAYWPDRTAHVIKRLRNDWSEVPDRAKWPDATELLSLLASPPDSIVRQLPAAARDAIALCDNASVSRVELAEKLSRDPSLVQGLLRQANGALFGSGLNPVLRVDGAIDRVGIASTRAIVLASCVNGLLSKPGGKYDGMLQSVWTHMVNTGALARAVAPAFGADPEEAFAVSLLHDVGKLVIFDGISALRTAKRGPVSLPDAWLSSLIDHLHEPLGAVALQHWGLGANAADAVGAHHRRERPALQHPLAEALFVAERAEHAMRKRVPFDFEGLWHLGLLTGDLTLLQGILGRHLKAA